MRLLAYNIRYATGSGAGFHFPFPAFGYVKFTASKLAEITDFIKSREPDIVGLTEVDFGSYRTGLRSVNQARYISDALEHSHYHACKYHGGSWLSRVPVLRNQGNALLTAHHVNRERLRFFRVGVKRLIIELELNDFCVFLVHLSLGPGHRAKQLNELFRIVTSLEKPHVVVGDFNPLTGIDEINTFCDATGLYNANVANVPTYPSSRPRRELDFVLYSRGITMTNFSVLPEKYSDHLPIEFDFEID